MDQTVRGSYASRASRQLRLLAPRASTRCAPFGSSSGARLPRSGPGAARSLALRGAGPSATLFGDRPWPDAPPLAHPAGARGHPHDPEAFPRRSSRGAWTTPSACRRRAVARQLASAPSLAAATSAGPRRHPGPAAPRPGARLARRLAGRLHYSCFVSPRSTRANWAIATDSGV